MVGLKLNKNKCSREKYNRAYCIGEEIVRLIYYSHKRKLESGMWHDYAKIAKKLQKQNKHLAKTNKICENRKSSICGRHDGLQ